MDTPGSHIQHHHRQGGATGMETWEEPGAQSEKGKGVGSREEIQRLIRDAEDEVLDVSLLAEAEERKIAELEAGISQLRAEAELEEEKLKELSATNEGKQRALEGVKEAILDATFRGCELLRLRKYAADAAKDAEIRLSKLESELGVHKESQMDAIRVCGQRLAHAASERDPESHPVGEEGIMSLTADGFQAQG